MRSARELVKAGEHSIDAKRGGTCTNRIFFISLKTNHMHRNENEEKGKHTIILRMQLKTKPSRSADFIMRVKSLFSFILFFQAVRDKMAVVCRCHGVSGSCQTKTCFRRLSDFKEVATLLKKKYDKIINVVSKTKGSNKHMLRPRRGKRYTLRDLIALSPSPNYCRKSESRGTLGTVGRECNPQTTGKGSCAYMCCGRGYKTFTREIVERCNCEYVWCCYVKCKKCARTITVSTCK